MEIVQGSGSFRIRVFESSAVLPTAIESVALVAGGVLSLYRRRVNKGME